MAYTARKIMEAVIIELNKVNAPSVLLDDFNYFFNKAIQSFINKQYNIYDVNQQTTDNMRVLKAGALLKPKKAYQYADSTDLTSGVIGDDVKMLDSIYGATYEVDLPDDYFHLLNCVCIYKLKKRDGCHNAGDYWSVAAQRLTADLWAGVLNNLYARPLPRRPYYYIHNVNLNVDRPTNPIQLDENGQIIYGTDITPNITYKFELNSYNKEFEFEGGNWTINVNSTVQNYNQDPQSQSFSQSVRKGVDWINVTSTGIGVNVTVAPNTTTDTRFGYIDFVQDGSNKTLTFTVIQKPQANQILNNTLYYNQGTIPNSYSDISNAAAKTINTSPYKTTLDASDTRVIWFAFNKDQMNVTQIVDMLNQPVNFNKKTITHTDSINNQNVTTAFDVYYFGNETDSPNLNNKFTITLVSK